MSLIFFVLVLLCCSSSATKFSNPTTFLAIGDWGAGIIAEDYQETQKAVAYALDAVANTTNAAFVINTGDNFYYCGVKNTTDPQWEKSYESVYHSNLSWINALGNHDYAYNVDAQIEYGKFHPNWIMPSRYYSKRISLAANISLSIVVLDSSPCVADYRGNNSHLYDPCSPEYPTSCGGPACQFHQHVISQSCKAQAEWLKATLDEIPSQDWLIIVSHHPSNEMDVVDFTEILQAHGFDLFINGHDHRLVLSTINGVGGYVTSGAGCYLKLPKKVAMNAPDLPSHPHHQKTDTWLENVAGFTSHTFNEDFSKLTTKFISYQGKILNSFTISKREKAGRN